MQQQAHNLIESDRVEGTAVYGADRQRIGSIERVMIEKSVFMVQGENTVVVQYDVSRPRTATLGSREEGGPGEGEPQTADSLSFEIRPLIAFRDYHNTTHENSALNRNQLSQRQLDIASSRGHIDNQVVEFTPFHIRKKLLH